MHASLMWLENVQNDDDGGMIGTAVWLSLTTKINKAIYTH